MLAPIIAPDGTVLHPREVLGSGAHGQVYGCDVTWPEGRDRTAAPGDKAAVKLRPIIADRAHEAAEEEGVLRGVIARGLPEVIPTAQPFHWPNPADNQSYLVIPMARAERSLYDLIETRPGGIPSREVVDLVRLIAVGLDALNRAGFVHGDIGPSNLLLYQGAYRISDFSVAAYVPSTAAVATYRKNWTWACVPPEFLGGWMNPLFSDQFSLAATVVWLVTGRPWVPVDLIRAGDYAELMDYIGNQPANLEHFPKGARPVMARALHKTPTARFPSSGQFLEALGASLGRRSPYDAVAAVTQLFDNQARTVSATLIDQGERIAALAVQLERQRQDTAAAAGAAARARRKRAWALGFGLTGSLAVGWAVGSFHPAPEVPRSDSAVGQLAEAQAAADRRLEAWAADLHRREQAASELSGNVAALRDESIYAWADQAARQEDLSWEQRRLAATAQQLAEQCQAVLKNGTELGIRLDSQAKATQALFGQMQALQQELSACRTGLTELDRRARESTASRSDLTRLAEQSEAARRADYEHLLKALDEADRKLAAMRKDGAEQVAALGGDLAALSEEFTAVNRVYQLGGTVAFATDPSGRRFVDRVSVAKTSLAGQDLSFLGAFKRLRHLDLSDSGVGEEALQAVSTLKGLTVLILSRTAVKDDGLRHLASLSGLSMLGLSGCGVVGPGVRHLTGLAALEVIDFSESGLTDDGTSHLGQIRNLKTVFLAKTAITDKSLANLKNLTNLTTLDLNDCKQLEGGLYHLLKLDQLTVLKLKNTKMTTKDVEPLAHLGALEVLQLTGTQVDNAVAKCFAALKKLRELYLDETAVTDDLVAELANLAELKKLVVTKSKVTAAAVKPLKDRGIDVEHDVAQ
jgi:Leucine-rich repeat (LRR) protein